MNQTHSPEPKATVMDTWCPDCAGEGTIYTATTGGWFDSAQGQWYPHEVAEPCHRCASTGRVWIEELTDSEREELLDEYA